MTVCLEVPAVHNLLIGKIRDSWRSFLKPEQLMTHRTARL